MDTELDFSGKTILVTGSGRNIGRAIILEFAARGANVIINARTNRAEAEDVERAARDFGAETLIVMGEPADPRVVDEMRQRAEGAFGRVDGQRRVTPQLQQVAERFGKAEIVVDDQ